MRSAPQFIALTLLCMFCLPTSLAAAEPAVSPAAVPCRSIKDCWLDSRGNPIKRPRHFRGKALPRGNCGDRLHWLRNVLTCDQNVCTATHIGDRC